MHRIRIAAAVMAKLPAPGAVKTRLSPPLAPEQAALLARALLDDALAVLADAAPLSPVFAVAGEAAPAAHLAGPGIRILPQRGDGLAARMTNAAADLLADHAGVLLFGADTLGLVPADLLHAALLLAAPGPRLVLGPSADGGYWLVGMKRADLRLFQGIAWSTPGVLDAQLARCAACGIAVSFARRLSDCDEPEDLAQAARAGGPRTRAALAALGITQGR